MNKNGSLASGILGLSLLGSVQAALIEITTGSAAGNAVYDDVADLTWIKDANLATSNTFGLSYNIDLGDHPDDPDGASYTEQILINGRMTWGAALHWIDAMNDANYLGFDDWRLSETNPINGSSYNYNWSVAGDTDNGYNISALGTAYAAATGSDLAYMFYNNLDGVPFRNPDYSPNESYGLINGTGPFDNLQSNDYWSGTESEEHAPLTHTAWLFSTFYGFQDGFYKGYDRYVWAVRSGNAGDHGQVPLPGTLLLTGLGALGLRLVRRRVC